MATGHGQKQIDTSSGTFQNAWEHPQKHIGAILKCKASKSLAFVTLPCSPMEGFHKITPAEEDILLRCAAQPNVVDTASASDWRLIGRKVDPQLADGSFPSYEIVTSKP